MNSSHEREQALFVLAAAKPIAERAVFLDHECGGDAALRRRLEALLMAHDQAEPILDAPATPVKATMKLEFADVPDETVGQKIGRYKILEKVGEGGCGVVYVAQQTEPVRRRVALKVIKLGMDTKQVVARFEAERQALAMMDHPNIAKVLDAGSTETGRPYFVMELVRGIRITDYCDQTNLSTGERLDLFIQVCHAIQHAHQKGIIHRDIKPSNILVTLHDAVAVPKVIDFGIAKATEGKLTDATVYTRLHQFIGTPAYMSPEQAEMSGLDVDTRSDIYSLGVLLYELLTGRTPFDGQELVSLGIDAMRKTIRETEPARPSTKLATMQGDELTTTAKRRSVETTKLAKLLRGDLDWIVMKCLEKDRTRRYDTANGLASDLKRHLNNEAVIARPPGSAYRFQKMVRRNKLAFAAAAAVAVALLLGIIASTWQAVQATQAKQNALAAQVSESVQRQKAEANEQKAQTEAARSAEVARFMKDMLKGVGPSVALGRDATLLREILDQTAQRLDALKDQPDVEADLRETLGVVYRDLSDYPRAEAMLKQSLALRRALYGNESASVASALNNLADVLRLQFKDVEAEAAFREALAIRRTLFGDENLEVADSLYGLGEALRRFRAGRDPIKFAESGTRHLEALAIRRKLLGNENLKVAESLVGYATSLKELGTNAPKSEPILREALQIQRHLLGNEHPTIAYTLHNLAAVLGYAGRREEAEDLYREAVAMNRKLLGDSRETAFTLWRQVGVTTNRLEALALNREAAAMTMKVLGITHFETGEALKGLTWRLREAGQTNELEALYREALAFWNKKDADNAQTFCIQSELGYLLLGQKRYAEAELLLQSGYEGLKHCKDQIPDKGKSRPKEALQHLVQLYEATNRPEQTDRLKKELESMSPPASN